MSVEQMDKDALNTLTDEERAALAEDEHTEAEKAAMQEIAGDDDDEGEDDETDDAEGAAAAPIEGTEDEGDTASEDNKETEAAAEGTKEAAAAASEIGADDDENIVLPRYESGLPEDFDDQVKGNKEAISELNKRLRDGDIEMDEYQSQMSDLNDRRDGLNDLRTRANMAASMNAQAAKQEWNLTVKRFARRIAKGEGIDYTKDETRGRDLDAFVKVLAADEKNADKTYTWFLTEAHKRVKALHGIPGKPAGEAEGEGKPIDAGKPAKQAKPQRKPPVGDVPKNLSQVPGADGPGDVSGEFSDLDGLEGLELEDAIAKMSPAQRERWLKAA